MQLVLASGSPRRRRILAALGLVFDVAVPEVEEIVVAGDPRASVAHNAERKCAWGRARYPAAAVLAADTAIGFEGRVILKPADRSEAAAFLRRFSGRTHTVMTGVAMAAPDDAAIAVWVDVSTVRFRTLAERDIAEYLDAVQPLDRAGAYDIDDHGDRLVASYEGSYTNIVGLPVAIVRPWCERLWPGKRGNKA